jgi:hypothetical protein
MIQNRTYTKLSEQDPLECLDACKGGLASQVFRHSKSFGGIIAARILPYQPHDKGNCKRNLQRVPESAVNETHYVPLNETFIMYYLVHNGPVTAVMSIYRSFYEYKRGIYTRKITDSSHDDKNYHQVVIVGYGYEKRLKKEKFWIVRNSWVRDWKIILDI